MTSSVAALGLITLLSGCQTTNQGFATEREVDISETRIEFPADLLARKDFKIKSVKVQEDGSYRREAVLFTGGYFTYDRYFRGGLIAITDHTFPKMLDKYYSEFTVEGDIHKTHADIGDVYYATLYGKGLTCISMSGNVGTGMPLRGGYGYPGQTDGEYCEKGKKPELAQTVLKWVKQLKLR